MIEEPSKERVINLNIWLSLNWIPLVAALFVLLNLVPYFLSPFVYIVPNAMDEALVQVVGVELIKPLLYLGFLLGCILSWIPIRFYRSLFSRIKLDGEFKLEKGRQGMAIIAPFFGVIPQLIYGILSRITPEIQPWEWGPIVNLFFILPAIGFMVVSSLGWIVVRWSTAYHENIKIQFSRIIGAEKIFLIVGTPIA
ncbi:MAG: hypothetical protein ACTSUB_05695 [Candidatus Thorarchaeota archaeon]